MSPVRVPCILIVCAVNRDILPFMFYMTFLSNSRILPFSMAVEEFNFVPVSEYKCTLILNIAERRIEFNVFEDLLPQGRSDVSENRKNFFHHAS